MAAESDSGDTPVVTGLLTVLVTELLTVGGPVVEVTVLKCRQWHQVSVGNFLPTMPTCRQVLVASEVSVTSVGTFGDISSVSF